MLVMAKLTGYHLKRKTPYLLKTIWRKRPCCHPSTWDLPLPLLGTWDMFSLGQTTKICSLHRKRAVKIKKTNKPKS